MRTAPKDKVILVADQLSNEAGKFYVVPAYFGRPKGFEDKDAKWWGLTFATSPEVMWDHPELHAKLISIKPIAWKPNPFYKEQKRARRYHYAIMTEEGGKGEQQGCAWGKNIKTAESNIAADCHGKLRKTLQSKCKECNS